MSFLNRIAARAVASGPTLQPKDAGIRREVEPAPHEKDEAPAMRTPLRRMEAKLPDEEPKVARASAKHDDEMKEPAVTRAPAADDAPQVLAVRRSAAEDGEEPKAHRAAENGEQDLHRAAAPEEEPKARPSRHAVAAGVHDPESDETMHRAAAKEEPQDDPLRRARGPGPEELSPENSPVPNDPPQTGVKPLVMAIRRETSPAAPPAAPVSNVPSSDTGQDASAAWTPAAEQQSAVAQAPLANSYEPPAPPLFASPPLRFGDRPDVVIGRVDVLVQEPAARAAAGTERSASRALRARYLRSL